MNKAKLIAYWVVTALLAANYAFAGVMYLQQGPDVQMGAKVLGYPLYFMVILGYWKLAGAIAIVIPKTPVVKEWAYAGMFINLTAASMSNYISGLGTKEIIAPLTMIPFVIASWLLRPASRRFEKPFWS